MKTRLALLGLAATALFVLLVWVLLRPGGSQGPVTIRCARVITRPQIASSMNAVLILAPDGTVWGWGDNAGALMGPSEFRGRFRKPARVNVGSDWMKIAAGFSYGIGIKTDGTLWGWSFNPWRGPSGASLYTNPPVRLAEGSNWVAVASGADHALGLRADGTLWGWGQNNRGQAGVGRAGGTSRQGPPARIGTNSNWAAIAASTFGSLGLQWDGTLWHWGFVHAGYSQGPDVDLTEPTRVNDSTNWTGIAAADYCFIGRQRDGTVWVWGPNAASLGSPDRQTPFAIPLDGGVVMAEGGNTHLLLLTSKGELWSGGPGQNGASGFESPSARGGLNRVGDRKDWTAVWSTITTSFGMTQDGTVWTWGTDLGKTGDRTLLFREVFDAMRRLGLPVQPARRTAGGTSRPWPLAIVVTNAVAAPR